MSNQETDMQPAVEGTTSAELFASLDGLRSVIRAVAAGETSRLLEIQFPESHPVGALTLSINAMMEALDESRKHSESYSRELSEKIDTIERQQAAIRELSTPIIEVWPGVLCAPIIGVLDSVRATEMTRTLLATIVQKKTPLVIIDVTGIDVMDTRASDNFVRMARSVRLLGAKCVLSGVHPNIARTIVHLGIDLSGIESYRSMRDALYRYVRTQQRQRRTTNKTTKAADK
jgi:rsbT co-antagonist protein RsbR